MLAISPTRLDFDAIFAVFDADVLDHAAPNLKRLAVRRRIGERVLKLGDLFPMEFSEIGMPPRSPDVSLRNPRELAAETSRCSAVRHADTRRLQSDQSDVHFCATPSNVRPGIGATVRARL